MWKALILIAVVFMGVFAYAPQPISAVNDKPAQVNDLAKKFAIVSRKLNDQRQSDILKNIEFKRLGNREFLVGEYCLNERKGVGRGWEGVQLWVPVDTIEDLMVFTEEAKAWSIVDGNEAE